MVVQISVDIALTDEEYNRYNGNQFEDIVADTLEHNEFTVLGAAWKATWTDEGYAASEPPISSD